MSELEKFKDDPQWSGNHIQKNGSKGIGGTHFFQWLKRKEVDGNNTYFVDWWPLYIKEFPQFNTKDYREAAEYIFIHYYECSH